MKQIPGTDHFAHEDGYITGLRVERLRPKITRSGYEEVTLYLNKGGKISVSVHRTIAKLHIPNPENKPFVNHIDGNKTNNSAANLEWVTHQENMEHAKNHELVHIGERNAMSKLKNVQVEEICKLLEYGLRNVDIGRQIGVPPHAISLIRAGTVWRHISCKYQIPKKSRSLSEETAHWICRKCEEGLTPIQIYNLSDNAFITKDIIDDIKRKRIYKDISNLYSF